MFKKKLWESSTEQVRKKKDKKLEITGSYY